MSKPKVRGEAVASGPQELSPLKVLKAFRQSGVKALKVGQFLSKSDCEKLGEDALQALYSEGFLVQDEGAPESLVPSNPPKDPPADPSNPSGDGSEGDPDENSGEDDGSEDGDSGDDDSDDSDDSPSDDAPAQDGAPKKKKKKKRNR